MSLAPPFTRETAQAKVKKAQDLWNTQYARPPQILIMQLSDSPARKPSDVVKAYTEDSVWRNRSSFLKGHEKIVEFLTKKWEKEKSYRLRKELVRPNCPPHTRQ